MFADVAADEFRIVARAQTEFEGYLRFDARDWLLAPGTSSI